MKKVVVTGATGFIGSHLCEMLLKSNISVIGVDVSLDRLNRFEEYTNFRPVVADFSLYDNLADLIDDDSIDVFYHFAWNGVNTTAFRDGVLQLENSIYAIKALDDAIKLNCRKFVFAGTYNEYETVTISGVDHYPARYTNLYGASKLAADIMLRAKADLEGIGYCSGLIPMVYGEGLSAPNLVNVVLSNFITGEPSKLVEGNNLYDLIYVDDVARAFIAIGEKGIHMTRYYVGHRTINTFKENITRMRDVLSPNSELLFGEYHETQMLDYSLIDTEKLYMDTGFECVANFKSTMQSTYDWLKSTKRSY